ncbi:transposase, Ptta/En/Spm, transposase, Tnp1/En/Spm-like protein [Tanacetum coccineum]
MLCNSAITRYAKFRREYGKPGGVKLSVTFDALNRISGKHEHCVRVFLGDMFREHIGLQILSWKKERYFDVDLTVRKLVMNRLGQLLRNFRRKLRQTYILPNQDTPSKLNEVPAKYTAILKAEDWVNFVNYTATEEYKVKSAKAKMARSKCVFPHTMGRGGYAHVKEKMIEKKNEQDEEPTRGTLWLKGRETQNGEYQDDEIRSVGDKLKETKDKIQRREPCQVEQGTDAMTLLMKEFVLKDQLDAARREREEKELLIKSMSSKMSQTEGMVTELKNQLAAQEGQLQSTPTQLTPLDETVKSVGAKYTTRSIRKDSSSHTPILKKMFRCGGGVVGGGGVIAPVAVVMVRWGECARGGE